MLNELLVALDSPQVFTQARGLTLFAPNNDALGSLDEAKWSALLSEPSEIALLISEHLIIGQNTIEQLGAAGEISNASAQTLLVTSDGVDVRIGDDATVVEADVTASNGVVHIIDQLIAEAD